MMSDPRFVIAGAVIMITAILDFGIFLMLLLHGDVSKDVLALGAAIVGTWNGAVMFAVGYWLGSSHGSQTKDAARDETVRNLTTIVGAKP